MSVAVPDADAAVAACVRRERELLTPRCRADPARVAALLADDFCEFGASGRRWDRASTVAALTADTDVEHDPPIQDTEMTGRLLADGLVLLTYRSQNGDRAARRSSLWRLEDGRWRVFFHQGTLLAPSS